MNMVVISYALLCASTVMFSFMFLFSQLYEKHNGSGLFQALSFNFYGKFAVIFIMLCVMKFSVSFSWFSLLITSLSAIDGILMTFFTMKAFSVTNLSVFSVFSMLGGMILPFLLGVAVYDENMTVSKALCCVLIVISVILTAEKGQASKKSLIYYAAVFILNGMSGVLSKIHQSSAYPHVDSPSYMFWSSVVGAVMCLLISLIAFRKFPEFHKVDFVPVAGNGILGGVANLFLLISLNHVPASVQYPIITGGVMALSTFISVAGHEKVSTRSKVAAGLAFAASVLMAF